MKIFRTLYLNWIHMGCLWCAKDPIDKDTRWTIEKTDGIFRYRAKHIINISEAIVAENDVFEKVAWTCLAVSLRMIVDNSINDGSLRSMQNRDFLESINLIYGISNSKQMDNWTQL